MIEGNISPMPNLTGQDAFDEAVSALDSAGVLMARYLDDEVLDRIATLATEIDLQSPRARSYLGSAPLPERADDVDHGWLTEEVRDGLLRAKKMVEAAKE